MATKARPTDVDVLEGGASKGDVSTLLEHIKENPLMYAAAAAFIALCAVAGITYRVIANSNQEKIVAEYARALGKETPVERATALAALAQKDTPLKPEIMYLQAEAAYTAQEYASAEGAFEELRAKFPDYEFTPDAVEGLGFIAEERQKYDDAILRYQEVKDKWPNSFAALRQPYNLGRVHERAGSIEPAIAAYQNQLEVFPGSILARNSQVELDRLRASHADLFPKEELAPPLDATDATTASPIGDLELNQQLELTTPEISEPAAQTPTVEEATPAETPPSTASTGDQPTTPEISEAEAAPELATTEQPTAEQAPAPAPATESQPPQP